MADDINAAHVPDSPDPAPPNTHGTETPRESVAPAELAAGTVRVASQSAPTKITPASPAMANPAHLAGAVGRDDSEFFASWCARR